MSAATGPELLRWSIEPRCAVARRGSVTLGAENEDEFEDDDFAWDEDDFEDEDEIGGDDADEFEEEESGDLLDDEEEDEEL